MNDIFNSLGNFLFWVFAIFIAILAGVVWFMFEHWLVIIAIPILLFVIFFVLNFKEIQESYKIGLKEIEQQEEEKRLTKK